MNIGVLFYSVLIVAIVGIWLCYKMAVSDQKAQQIQQDTLDYTKILTLKRHSFKN